MFQELSLKGVQVLIQGMYTGTPVLSVLNRGNTALIWAGPAGSSNTEVRVQDQLKLVQV